jgi:hypothetical protein
MFKDGHEAVTSHPRIDDYGPNPLHGGTRRSDPACTTTKNSGQHALAGQADLWDGWPSVKPTPGRGRYGTWHPVDLPKGYHALPRGQAGQVGR